MSENDIHEYLDAFDENDDPTPYSTKRYDQIHDAIIDTGVRGLIGYQTYEAFHAIRRYVWRAEEIGHPKIAALRAQGKVVSWASQSKLAELARLSRPRMVDHITRLRQLGWLRSHVGPNGSLLYEVGFLANEPGQPIDLKADEIFFKNVWERRFYSAMAKWGVDQRGYRFKNLPFEAKDEFARAYLTKLDVEPR